MESISLNVLSGLAEIVAPIYLLFLSPTSLIYFKQKSRFSLPVVTLIFADAILTSYFIKVIFLSLLRMSISMFSYTDALWVIGAVLKGASDLVPLVLSGIKMLMNVSSMQDGIEAAEKRRNASPASEPLTPHSKQSVKFYDMRIASVISSGIDLLTGDLTVFLFIPVVFACMASIVTSACTNGPESAHKLAVSFAYNTAMLLLRVAFLYIAYRQAFRSATGKKATDALSPAVMLFYLFLSLVLMTGINMLSFKLNVLNIYFSAVFLFIGPLIACGGHTPLKAFYRSMEIVNQHIYKWVFVILIMGFPGFLIHNVLIWWMINANGKPIAQPGSLQYLLVHQAQLLSTVLGEILKLCIVTNAYVFLFGQSSVPENDEGCFTVPNAPEK